MKIEEIYNTWKDQKGQIDIRENLSDRIMKQVYHYEQTRRKPLFDMQRLVEFISDHPLAKAALVATGAVTGLVRLVFMIIVILSKGVING